MSRNMSRKSPAARLLLAASAMSLVIVPTAPAAAFNPFSRPTARAFNSFTHAPPRAFNPFARSAAIKVTSMTTQVSTVLRSPSQPGGWVMINPQPLPPRVQQGGSVTRPGSWVTINPQPLPPRIGIGGASTAR
jgi:hypothetical protein